MNQCNFCGNKNFTLKEVDYIYKKDNSYMIVEEVPAEECDYCGEQYFEATVLKKIEKDFFDIQKSRKQPDRKIEIPVERYAG